MAKINFVRLGHKRKKKMRHFKIKMRQYSFRLSLLINLGLLYIYVDEHGHLTNIIETYNKHVAPLVESIINQLPL